MIPGYKVNNIQFSYACREYFKMRQELHGKTDWVDVTWTHGVLNHSIQQDGCSCGVYVMQVQNLFNLATRQNVTEPRQCNI